MNITIRRAKMSDLESLEQMMFELHDYHHQACPEHFKSAEEIQNEKSIISYLDHPECIVYVAELADELVGFVTGQFSELVSVVSKPVMMASVDELFVIERLRSTGVAQQLFSTIESEFEDYGVKQLFVEVWDFNKPATYFYKKQGLHSHINWLRKPLGGGKE
ncbi:GNAT family N-acetyltransferase [Vibrio sp. Of7-15]|uniref:GNAT family N-acetyltransferase n=1 Tax=Vibrio sp. Of7-15 TaxID=2724879 RepID=UPI001EF37CE7|nr:GNAT family N-acetyltransferase [Vibrio sp. Of7-15]MCG7499409.1 GNAT family N-acetyltransferase [Vibrio sp. Of7-15]